MIYFGFYFNVKDAIPTSPVRTEGGRGGGMEGWRGGGMEGKEELLSVSADSVHSVAMTTPQLY